LSPSSVLYSIEGDNHIKLYRKLITYILAKKYEVILVPHNMMAISPTLKTCDLEVSKKILNEITNTKVHLVHEDLDVYLLKGIIAKAELHIGDRYHSIIASLSSSVPTIAMAWHEKYRDIMSMYAMEKYIKYNNSDEDILFDFIDELIEKKYEIREILTVKQSLLLDELKKNMELFMENYHEMQTLFFK